MQVKDEEIRNLMREWRQADEWYSYDDRLKFAFRCFEYLPRLVGDLKAARKEIATLNERLEMLEGAHKRESITV